MSSKRTRVLLGIVAYAALQLMVRGSLDGFTPHTLYILRVLTLTSDSYLISYTSGPDPYNISLSIDGNQKLSHLSCQGTASRELAPRLNTYYGEAEQEMRELERGLEPGAKPDLNKFIGALEGASDEVEVTDCPTAIHCSRPEAGNTQSVCDILGLIGAVCAHTIPVRGSFLDMRFPEQFIHYLLIIITLLKVWSYGLRNLFSLHTFT